MRTLATVSLANAIRWGTTLVGFKERKRYVRKQERVSFQLHHVNLPRLVIHGQNDENARPSRHFDTFPLGRSVHNLSSGAGGNREKASGRFSPKKNSQTPSVQGSKVFVPERVAPPPADGATRLYTDFLLSADVALSA
jgi:hypothetical protein